MSKAQETSSFGLVIDENIILQQDRGAKVQYKLKLKNNSDVDLISSFVLSIPYDNFSLISSSVPASKQGTNKLVFDLFEQPVELKSDKSVEVSIDVDNLIKDHLSYAYFSHSGVSAGNSLDHYARTINYPESYGTLIGGDFDYEYVADNTIKTQDNEALNIFWGQDTLLKYSLDFSIEDKGHNIFAFLNNNLNTNFVLSKVVNINDVYYDKSGNNYFLSNDQKNVQIEAVINKPVKYVFWDEAFKTDDSGICSNIDLKSLSEMDPLDSLNHISTNFTLNYQDDISTTKALEELVGDEFDFALTSLCFLRGSHIKSYLSVGYDLSSVKNPASKSIWINWFDDGWNIKQVGTNNALLLEASALRVESFIINDLENLGFYEKLYDQEIYPKFEVWDSELFDSLKDDPDISVKWDRSRKGKRIEGTVSIENKTSQILYIDNLSLNSFDVTERIEKEGLILAVLPHSIKNIPIYYELSYLDLLKSRKKIEIQVKTRFAKQDEPFDYQSETITDYANVKIELGALVLVAIGIFINWTVFKYLHINILLRIKEKIRIKRSTINKS